MKQGDPTKSVSVSVVRETEKAILIRTIGGKELWIPKSQIASDSEVHGTGEEGTLIVSEWIYKQKDWDKEDDEIGEL